MRQRKKKWFMVLMILVLAAVSILAGCGNKETEQANNHEGSAAEKEAVKKDIHILLSHSNAKYAMQAKEDDRYVKELSDLSGYNLKYEFLGHGSDFTQQMTIRFASGDLPDLIRTDSINSTIHPGALEQGVFMELGTLIDKYGPNIKKNIPEQAWKSPRVSKDGKIYGIPALTSLPASRVVYIRQDWLDKLNMKQPKTVEEYLAFFEAVKKNDMNGNGDPNDEYGFYVRENLIYSKLFFTAFGAHPDIWYMRDGQMTPGIIMPEMKEAIAFWKTLYDKGYVNPNLFTNKSSDWAAGIKKGEAGLWSHSSYAYPTAWAEDSFANQTGVKISMIAPPKGPKGQGLSPESDQIYFVWVIPSKTKNPEEIIKFLDWAWSDKADEFFAYGIEGVNYQEENGKIKWDPNSEANKENGATVFYQLSINPGGDGRMTNQVLDMDPKGEILIKANELAAEHVIPNAALHMPTLESLKTHPELVPGTGSGTLFLDMFAKVITGKEELDPAFDKFVKEWKRRGGEQAIKEATEWYNTFHNKNK
jgi:putative aldouronate transport system substrate-binding protein